MVSIFLTLRDGTKVGNLELESKGIVSFEFLFPSYADKYFPFGIYDIPHSKLVTNSLR